MVKYKSITEMAEEIRDEALDNIEYSGITLRELCDKLKSNEYAPVVRCGACRWFADNNGGNWFGCQMFNAIRLVPEDAPKENDYCSYGEKMESEGNQ